MTRRVTYEVYDQANPGLLLDTLTTDSDRSWEEVLNEPGSGSVTLHADDTQVGLLDCRNYVRCLVDGEDRFAWLVEKRIRKTIPSDGKPSSKLFTASGRGVLALLETAVVVPELGAQRQSPPTRLFNFAALDYLPVGWSTATRVKRQVDITGDPPPAGLVGNQWDGAPIDFPADDDTYWIWGRNQSYPTSDPPQPEGRCYFRKSFNVSPQMSVRLFISADDGFELYLDGALVAQETRAYMWAETKVIDVLLDEGDHLLAVVGVNIHRDNSEFNVAGFVLIGIEVTEGGESYGNVVVRTDETWLVLDYPAVAPTMTPGEIWRILLDEAQHLYALTGVTLDFDDDVDSNGVPWSVPVDLELRVGTTYLQVLAIMLDMSIDARMTPDLQLQLFNRGTIGSDLTGSVLLDAGLQLSRLEHDTECPIMNLALIKLHTGQGTTNILTGESYLYAADGPSIAANGGLVGYLELGTAPSGDQAERTVAATFDDTAYEHVEVSGTVEERDENGDFWTAERPLVDWLVGDVILMPGLDDTYTDTTILSLAVTDDPAGGPDPVFKFGGTQTPILGS